MYPVIHNKFFWAAALIMLVAFLSNCGQKIAARNELSGLPSVENAISDGKLALPLSDEPQGLNPLISNDPSSRQAQAFIFQGLMRLDSDLAYTPELAERYEFSPDGKKWTFYLRKDVQWHDGAPFTAEDVIFTYEKVLDPKTRSPYREKLVINGEPVKFTLLDRYTIRATLPEPYAPFMQMMALPIVPKHVLEGKDKVFQLFARKPIGTGPFIYYEWQNESHLTLLANKTFYRGNPKLGSVVFQFIPKDAEMDVALRNNNVQAGILPLESYLHQPTRNNLFVYAYPGLSYTYLGLDLAAPQFQDVRTRQAIAHAVNILGITQELFHGAVVLQSSPIAFSSWASPEGLYQRSYDPEKAKKLLRSAGWVVDPKTMVLLKDGKPFSFTLLVDRSVLFADKAAERMNEDLKAVGIEMKVQMAERYEIQKILSASAGPKPFQAVLTETTSSIDPDLYNTWHSSQYPQGKNYFGFKNDRADTLLEKGRATIDTRQRQKIYASFSRILSEEQPCVFLWSPKEVMAVNQRVGGYIQPSVAGTFVFPEKAYIVK